MTVATLPLLFGAGLVTSAGPCVAPRYVAIAAFAQRSARPWTTTAIFAAGVVAASIVIGLGAGALGAVRAWSTTIDALLAVALAVSGMMTLWGAGDCRGGSPARSRPASASGIALAGAASALVVSPCCTPVLTAIGVATAGGASLPAALALASFAIGHAVPLIAAGALGRSTLRLPFGDAANAAAPTVSGALMLALGAYYGLIA